MCSGLISCEGAGQLSKRKVSRAERKASKSGSNRTPISGHKRDGQQLITPFNASEVSEVFVPVSWISDRLPEMLWASLIIQTIGREAALDVFRNILAFVHGHKASDQLDDLTITGISKLDDNFRDELIEFVLSQTGRGEGLACLLRFDGLPAKEDWERHLVAFTPELDILMMAVGNTLWHQSQEATDCRWVRVMAMVVAGKLRLAPELKERGKALLHYPDKYDQREVRPFIRTTEIGLERLAGKDPSWARSFWQEAWETTPCMEIEGQREQPKVGIVTSRQAVTELDEKLTAHWHDTHTTTAVDPKHDAIFGMAFFALRTLEEMMGLGLGIGILGRLGLRTILEVRINLRYLLYRDDPELWAKWRQYGAGQAKLNVLKFDESVDPPQYIDLKTIESIASEDVWEEFLNVNLAGWSGLDLRRLSERSGVKDAYDQHYSWTSGFAHGMWGAIRETCFHTCANPLHRLHRRPDRMPLQDTVEDAVVLVDEIVQDLSDAYPTFEWRLSTLSGA